MRLRIDNNFISRFENKFVKKSGCWIWNSSITNMGYGEFSISRFSSNQLAHRVSYQIYIGEIPKGLFVLHKCDNPKCVNPDHLFLGTQKDNVHDMYKKERDSVKGIDSHFSKLDEEKVLLIRKEYSYGMSQRELSEMFNVDPSNISYIVNRKSWKHI